MRVAVVDVGSNTARVLVADVAAGCVDVVAERRARLGLGEEIARTGTLSRKTVATVARLCRDYADRARGLGAEHAQTIVTAPGRQGRSPELLVAALKQATQLPVRVLSAEEEGRLSFHGAVSRAGEHLHGKVAVVDVGGGSTEIVVGTALAATWVRSVDLGSIRLTRQFLRHDPPTGSELVAARELVRTTLGAVTAPLPDIALATGGSARAVAKLVGPSYAASEIEKAIALLSRRTSAKVGRKAGIHPVRAASVLGGALLLAEAARVLDRPLVLARGGVREGAALALAGQRVAAAA
jgi:exopolyphosphatase/guanosine-5'-triphosphate,3'-diphosphate pyrophosphatase